ncbi:tripartite tricarboxylate transporter substrate-binding protein [Rhodoplanes sp. TEM]|uniref:Tripartite tricarboxylate transporter substrate-binding protein n=1 Tax=Rhodoplanes tepidamans TaxID=200616 RepID=A0ABT5JFX1_RHOTP|nr:MULTISPECIES: tripartite tricarboxylate transporter substrate-binding protein [Rhodoplanes]MDC7788516.1 tripartite tricarboxylate transporter substrate-binding protein [Rhodoplanes tepidamans]MDC7985115.1 tripartite tricarboxylate transporter substrate-binding protein [Rhodoplanes sp. TEM]MDQ0353425.1 tripartite-type tricarboxylate transporter receptor subunit TctC [Rhodoplanes tepidamans]
MRTILHAALAGLALLGLGAGAQAESGWPTKPITILVPAAAGGPTDTVARLIAESMTRTLGQTVLVENQGGAGGTLGMGRIARTPADGYTLAIWHIAHATAPALYDTLKYDPVADFDHVGRITDVPMTIVSKAALPPTSIGALIEWMKANKATASFGHAGVGSAAHLCSLLFMSEVGVQLAPVAYRGTGPAMNDLLGGQIDLLCDQTTNTTNHIREGRIKGYAVTTKARVSSLPDLPTLDETALRGFEVSAWHAMWAPRGLPKEAIDKLVPALQTALRDPKVIERFASLGTEPVPLDQATPAALKAQLVAEVEKWGKVIRAAGVKGN